MLFSLNYTIKISMDWSWSNIVKKNKNQPHVKRHILPRTDMSFPRCYRGNVQRSRGQCASLGWFKLTRKNFFVFFFCFSPPKHVLPEPKTPHKNFQEKKIIFRGGAMEFYFEIHVCPTISYFTTWQWWNRLIARS